MEDNEALRKEREIGEKEMLKYIFIDYSIYTARLIFN